MARSTRKQREIEQREHAILRAGLQMLIEQGYLGLRMEQIAAQVEYSKGTVYQHFPNKEEIILALANEALTCRSNLFAHAATMRMRSRERLAAIGAAAEVFVERFPHFFLVEQIMRINSVWEKTSAERRRVMKSCETRCMGIVSGVVRDAIAHGDLQLPDGCTPEDLVFGLWAINTGAFTILSSSESLQDLGVPYPLDALRRNQNSMLDGYGWRPLSHEFDFRALIDVLKAELLATDILDKVVVKQ